MEPKKYEELKEMVELRHLSPAINEETGAPVLSRVRNSPGLGYVHLDTFVAALEDQGLAIDPKTLNIVKAKKPAPPPPIKTVKGCDFCRKNYPTEEITTKDGKSVCKSCAEATKPEETPKPETWTKAELDKMSWEEIRTLAKKDPEVPGNKKKTELIKLLTGRPKL